MLQRSMIALCYSSSGLMGIKNIFLHHIPRIESIELVKNSYANSHEQTRPHLKPNKFFIYRYFFQTLWIRNTIGYFSYVSRDYSPLNQLYY